MRQSGSRPLRTPLDQRSGKLRTIGVLVLNIGALAPFLLSSKRELQQPPVTTINRASFAVAFDGRGITSISNPRDPLGAQFLAQGAHLGDTVVKYKSGDHDWADISSQDR